MDPEQQISPDDSFHVVLIDRRVLFANGITVGAIFIGADDPVLVRKRDPVIGDDGRREDGVRPAAFRASDAADPQRESPFWQEDASFVIGMDRETGGVPTGAGKAVELETTNDGIIINL